MENSLTLAELLIAGQPGLEVVLDLSKIHIKKGQATVPVLVHSNVPKIPWEMVEQVESFFRAVYAKHQAEAVCFLYFTPHSGGMWRFVAPEQEVRPGGLSWETPGSPPSGWYLAGSFHSHGRMTAFHSGADDHDELGWDGVHVTIGKATSLHPEHAASVVIGGKRYEVEIEDLIETAPPVAFPEDWMEQVREWEPPTTLVQAGQLTAIGQQRYGGELRWRGE